jgi:GAF domain-containing protein/HAMP domain-containing protein
MNIFKNLKLRTKLIGSFLLFAFIAFIFIFVSSQAAFERFSEDVPAVALIGEIGISTNQIQREVLQFVTSGREVGDRFDQSLDELNDLASQLQRSQYGATENEIVDLSEELATLSQAIIRSHRQTLREIAALNTLKDETGGEVFREVETALATQDLSDLDESSLAAHMANSHLAQLYFGQIVEAVQFLELEAMEYVAFGEEEAQEEFDEGEAELAASREALRQVWESEALGEPDSIERLDNVTIQIATKGRDVFNSHAETLSLLQELEELHAELDLAVTSAQASIVEDVRLGVGTSQRYLTIFFGIALVLAVLLGRLVTSGLVGPISRLVKTARQLGAGNLSVRAESYSRDEIGQLAQVFNQMADQLQGAFGQAEQQSQQRIRQLEITAEISRQLISILDVDDLLRQMVNSIQNAFGYYHVHVYLIDQNTGELVMREGTGEVGRQLKAKGHSLKLGEGSVGKVAVRGEAFLAEDVNEVSDFVRNPLLPKTQSELAVPIRKRDVTLGVLDMQNEEIGGFSEEDLTLMQSIADQIAVAVENARLFRAAQAAAIQAEELNRRFTREAWQNIRHKVASAGYIFTKSNVTPLPTSSSPTAEDEAWLPIMTRAVQQKELVHHTSEGNDAQQQTTCVSIPLMLRNEIIGVIGIERVPAPASTTETDSTPLEGEGQESDRDWTEDELATIRAVAEQVALALDTARLARETQRAAWRDRVVSESTAKVWATSEIEEVMKAAVAQLGDRLRASEVVIRLGKEDELLLPE